MAKPGQFTLRSLVVVIGVVAVLAALLVPPVARSIRGNSRTHCAVHLRGLWMSHLEYTLKHGSANGTGAEFLLKLQRGPEPLINNPEFFFCPVRGDPFEPERTSYRGPAMHLAKMKDVYPVAADKEGNHGLGGGGNVLIKTGEVGEYSETDPIWIRARTTTRD